MKIALMILMLTVSAISVAQQTIFSVMKGSENLGDREFEKGEFNKAVEYYRSSLNKDPNNIQVLSKLAQAYSLLKDHRNCIATLNILASKGKTLTENEMFSYAESQSATGNYPVAIAYYKKCLEHDEQNALI